jgi:hypothetical protein
VNTNRTKFPHHQSTFVLRGSRTVPAARQRCRDHKVWTQSLCTTKQRPVSKTCRRMVPFSSSSSKSTWKTLLRFAAWFPLISSASRRQRSAEEAWTRSTTACMQQPSSELAVPLLSSVTPDRTMNHCAGILGQSCANVLFILAQLLLHVQSR